MDGTVTRYIARSASDKTDDWPYWFVADTTRDGLNVTVQLLPEMRGYMPFLPKQAAIDLADLANGPDH